MGWERRGGSSRYYSRSLRRDGRVVRQYVGAGEAGEAAASVDQERRAARDAEREAMRSTLGRFAEADRQVAFICEAAETAARAWLLLGGYHQHDRGAWRRRRA
jgi:hypothetical protein